MRLNCKFYGENTDGPELLTAILFTRRFILISLGFRYDLDGSFVAFVSL
jgi:hypothetical protein